MESQSARLEREVEQTRWQLSGTLEELRGRMTPGRVVDQVIDYTRDSPAGDFFRNLGREVRENPLPLVVIGVGIAWLLLASNRTSRAAIAAAADNLASKARSASAAAIATFERAKRPFTGASEDSGMPARTGSEMNRTSHKEDASAVEPAYERR